MKKNKKTQAFTLIELIVVITILAILGTIAFIALQGYSAQARDSKRISDISNIKKSLELFSLNTGKYPKPDDFDTVSYSGELARYQGIVGDQVTTNLSRNLNEKPVDPLTGVEYTYSITHSQTEYELLSIYESDLVGFLPLPNPPLTGEGTRPNIFSNTNAASQNYPRIDGNYNGIYVKTSSFYLPTPSIINGNIWGNIDFIDDNTLIKSQVVTGGDNIPGVSTGGLDITLEVYEGTITEDSTDEQKSDLVKAIQTTFSGSELANDTMYSDILSKATIEDMVDFVDLVVLNRVEYISNNTVVNYSCDETTKPLDNEHITFSIGNPTEENQAYVQDADNCGYVCEEGYEYSVGDNACMLSECSGSIVVNATSNATTQSYGIPWSYNTTPGDCTFACNTNYTWDGDSCEADTQSVSCGGSLPANATPSTATTYTQTWNGSSWTPTTSWGEDQATCDFNCDSNYTWNGSGCEADTQSASCGGSLPANATASTATTYIQTWNGSSWIPTTSWGEDQATCDFNCNTNYTWNGSSCEADTQSASCGGSIPANATASTATTYIQTWNGSSWTPTTSWGEDQATCDFNCDTNYAWIGNSCEAQTTSASCTTQGEQLIALSTYSGCNTPDIIVCSGNGVGYTLSACNVGSTIASTYWGDSGGDYFQWGRNKGFSYGDDSHKSTPIENENYDPNNDTYGFVWSSSLSALYNSDWIEDKNDNLWGDNSGGGSDEQRQGPCSTGYHVPSIIEWSNLVTAFEGGNTLSNMGIELKLPKSGYRRYDNGNYGSINSYGKYWSSSPSGTQAYILSLGGDFYVDEKDENRAYGYSVRCFRN